MEKDILKKFDLQLFAHDASDRNVQVTTNASGQKDMSPTMKVFYDTALLENARENLIFDQFGDKQPIHGNKVEWRKFNTFGTALTPLTEGVIPDGKDFGMTKIEASTTQHGQYTTISDRLELESYDDVIYGATEEMGAAGAETMDILTRNVISAGTSVAYCPKVTAEGVATETTQRNQITDECKLTPEMVAKAATWLKKNKAPKIRGSYVALIHPSVAFDLRNSAEWKEYHKYNDTAPIFNGEIGELHGVRFVESNNCMVTEDGATNSSGGNSNYSVYATLFLGMKSYGVIEPNGESMEMIIKSREQIGGPLNQYSTIGFKFCHGAKILYPERILRVESGSSYSTVDQAN